MQLQEATRQVMGKMSMIFATFLYMLGWITRPQLYHFIADMDPKLLVKLLEQDAKE